MKLITEYKRKGSRPLKRISMNPAVFGYCYSLLENGSEYTTDKLVFENACYGLNKRCPLFYHEDLTENAGDRMVVSYINLEYVYLYSLSDKEIETPVKKAIYKIHNFIKNGHYDYVLISTTGSKLEDIGDLNPVVCRTWAKRALMKAYKKKDIEEIIQKEGQEHNLKPLRHRATFEKNKVLLWSDCVYMDIHKAHAWGLINLFPKIKDVVIDKINEANHFKEIGDFVNAQKCKDYPNIVVGCFGQKKKAGEGKDTPITWLYDLDLTPLYNRIVNDVRAKIENQYKLLDSINGALVYAQTDGLIYHHPNWSNVIDSKEIGEFGVSKIDDNKVWTYSCNTNTKEGLTGYTIYQYFENGKKKVVGDLPDIYKERVDLSIGKVVDYKRTRDKYGYVKYKLYRTKKVEIKEMK